MAKTDFYREVFSKNLRRIMEDRQKTQVDLVNDLGLNKSAVSTWFNGSRLPRMDKVDLLAKYLRVNRSDLIEEHSDDYIVPKDVITLSSPEERLINHYRSLSEEGQEKLSDYAADLVASGRYIKNNESDLVDKKEA